MYVFVRNNIFLKIPFDPSNSRRRPCSTTSPINRNSSKFREGRYVFQSAQKCAECLLWSRIESIHYRNDTARLRRPEACRKNASKHNPSSRFTGGRTRLSLWTSMRRIKALLPFLAFLWIFLCQRAPHSMRRGARTRVIENWRCEFLPATCKQTWINFCHIKDVRKNVHISHLPEISESGNIFISSSTSSTSYDIIFKRSLLNLQHLPYIRCKTLENEM